MKNRGILSKCMVVGVLASMMVSSNVYAYAVHSSANSGKEAKIAAAQEAEEKQKAEAQKKEAGILTFAHAIELARENNSSLKDIAASLDSLEDNRNRVAETMDVVMPVTGERFVVGSDTLSTLQSVNSLEKTIKSTRYKEELLNVSIPALVQSSFIDIKKNEASLAMAEKSLAVAQKQLEEAQLKLKLGMVSQTDFDKQKKSLEQSQSAIEQLKLVISNEYTSLRNLLGLPQDEKIVLDAFPAELTPVELDMNLDSYVSRAISMDPSIKSLEEELKIAEFNVNAYTYTQITESYKSKQATLGIQVRALEDARKNKDVAVRSAYNSLQTLQENQKALEAALEAAESDLKVAETNLQVGNITQLNYDQAALAVERAKFDILKNQYDYQQLKYSFDNPALLGSSSGQ